ncbi:hypothetical protein [Micromonospora robiginosa]|uniref:Uncharacterized protein n=1 Tax=Micromonospora robiginosa TaxID=2749844 RepID=A0AAF0P2P1_9ACTN|nr:hypothetical protein [Micromonospora ferruginea]WMF04604.1 hypothetical protein H1D33_08030 [Micromonospora ferruginea]
MPARFAPVRDAFHDLFATGRETGAALSVRLDGVPVVELGPHARCLAPSRT